MEHKVTCVLAMVLMLALGSLAQEQAGKANLLFPAGHSWQIPRYPDPEAIVNWCLFPAIPYAANGLGP